MNIINLLLKIYSYSPFIAVTDDNNFGTNEGKCNYSENQKPSYRFSVINFNLGNQIFYLFTYNFYEKSFKLYHRIKLEECNKLKDKCNNEKIKDKTEKFFSEHLSIITDRDIDIEKEFIIYRINNENERIEISNNKMNLYTTIILALIPIIIAFYDINRFVQYNLFEKVLSILLFFTLLNITVYIFNIMKVRGIEMSNFKDLKCSEEKSKKLLGNYYFDWQMLRDKAVIWVSYVKNIECWITYSLVLFVVLTISLNISTTIGKTSLTTVKDNHIYSIDISNLDNPYSNESIELNKIHLHIKEGQVDQLLIITNNADNKYANHLKNQFSIYEPKIKIKFFYDKSILDDDIIKFMEVVN